MTVSVLCVSDPLRGAEVGAHVGTFSCEISDEIRLNHCRLQDKLPFTYQRLLIASYFVVQHEIIRISSHSVLLVKDH